MTQEKLTLHRVSFMTNQEAEQAASRFHQLEDCLDAWVGSGSLVEVYTRRTVTQAMLKSLLKDCTYPLPPTYLRPSVIPLPDFLPGELVRMVWYFPGVVSGTKVRIIHLSYSKGYRYHVMDEATKVVGWVDPEGLEPLPSLTAEASNHSAVAQLFGERKAHHE